MRSSDDGDEHVAPARQLRVVAPEGFEAALAPVTERYDMEWQLDVVGLALGGEAGRAQPRRPTQLAGALHLGELGVVRFHFALRGGDVTVLDFARLREIAGALGAPTVGLYCATDPAATAAS